MPLLAFYPRPDSAALEQLVRESISPKVRIAFKEDPHPSHTEILICGRPTREQLSQSPNLKAVIIPWAGVPDSTRKLLAEFPDIAVHNLHHNAAPVAEHAIGLLLAVARNLCVGDRALRLGDWRPRYAPLPTPLLAGRRALILGAGAIGTRIARACEGLGLSTTLMGRNERKGVLGIGALHATLPSADVVMIALPGTPDTEGILSKERLSMLPRGAILVNVGRAAVVEERGLFELLQSGNLGGAGLDVWYQYPGSPAEREQTRPSAFPFQELDNVIMSPHLAGHCQDTARMRAFALAEMLQAAASGACMPNRVDLSLGY